MHDMADLGMRISHIRCDGKQREMESKVFVGSFDLVTMLFSADVVSQRTSTRSTVSKLYAADFTVRFSYSFQLFKTS